MSCFPYLVLTPYIYFLISSTLPRAIPFLFWILIKFPFSPLPSLTISPLLKILLPIIVPLHILPIFSHVFEDIYQWYLLRAIALLYFSPYFTFLSLNEWQLLEHVLLHSVTYTLTYTKRFVQDYFLIYSLKWQFPLFIPMNLNCDILIVCKYFNIGVSLCPVGKLKCHSKHNASM